MSWMEHHRLSEEHASDGDVLLRAGDRAGAASAYAEAARAERRALEALDPAKRRTLEISALNALSLHLRAEEPEEAETLAYRLLSRHAFSRSARVRVRNLLRDAMEMQDHQESGVRFARSRIELAVDGGDITRGAAPLSLIEAITKRTEAVLYRVAEFRTGADYRRRGQPSADLQRMYPTWLLQSEPGSYRFAVAVPEIGQPNMFAQSALTPHDLVSDTLAIVAAATMSPDSELTERVQDEQYRGVFLRLARDLSPTGRRHELLELGLAREEPLISLDRHSRSELNAAIKRASDRPDDSGREEVRGILRAVDLEHDWLLVLRDYDEVKVWGVGETVDDVIGPMINHPVIVSVTRRRNRLIFQDIEPDE